MRERDDLRHQQPDADDAPFFSDLFKHPILFPDPEQHPAQSVSAAGAAIPAAPGVMASDTSTPDADRRTDEQAEQELTGILESCELEYFPPETARVFENAIERLYYSENYRIGNAVLPQCRVCSKLRLLDNMILRDAEGKLAANVERRIKNSTAYTMATIFNCISESESDLMLDPYLNSLRAKIPTRRC